VLRPVLRPESGWVVMKDPSGKRPLPEGSL
jgi:hypothetical protein